MSELVSEHIVREFTVVGFPLYDGHGNNVATLTRSVSSFSLGDQRRCEVWGSVRTGASSGAPNSRYCASLGHVQDDESGLVYMRACYYESGTGRFVSEDPARDGGNWYGYCGGDPVNGVDPDGKYHWKQGWEGMLGQFTFGVAMDLVICAAALAFAGEKALATTSIAVAATMATFAFSQTDLASGTKTLSSLFRLITSSQVYGAIIASIAGGLEAGVRSNHVGFAATAAATAYSIMVLGALIACNEGMEE